MTKLLEYFNICVEVYGLEKTLLTIWFVVLFYVAALLTLTIVAKVLILNAKQLIAARKEANDEEVFG